ncbi:MAG: hypothetical protein Q9165_007960 [Trypethelium subeluteriae]
MSLRLWMEARDDFTKEMREKNMDEKQIRSYLSEQSSPEEAKKLCTSLADTSDAKWNKAEVGGKQVSTKWVSRIMDNIDRFVAIGDYAMKGAPETVGLAWFAVKQILNAAQNNYKLYGFFGEALISITEMLVLIRTFDNMYDKRDQINFKSSDIVDQLFKNIRSIYVAILDFGMSVTKHVKGKGWTKVKDAFKDAFNANLPEFQSKRDRIDKLKTVIMEGSQAAYQEKSFGKFDEMGNSLDSIGESLESIHRSVADFESGKVEMKEMFDELKQLAKYQPTIEELVQQEYEKIRASLDPLPSSQSRFTIYKEQRYANTCNWIFGDQSYKTWRASSNGLLWFRGDIGTGKSVLLSAIYERLRGECEDGDTVQYVCCDVGDGTVPTATAIQNTILAQIHDLAQSSERDTTLLQQANAAFKNPKDLRNKSESKANASREKKSGSYDFYSTLQSLLNALKLGLFLIIDSVGFLNAEEQSGLISALDDIRDSGSAMMRIMIASREEEMISSFFSKNPESKFKQLKLGQSNADDIRTVLDSELKLMPGWTQAERAEASTAVLAKTGSNFKYLSSVALPYLRQPFHRPIKNHLESLPDSFRDMYSSAIRQLSSEYRSLLRTALIWTLFADGPVTVNEIMDTFMGTYDIPESGETVINDISAEDAESGPYATPPLHIQQLKDAGSAFLDIENGFVTLKDYNSTWDYFVGEKHQTKIANGLDGVMEGICPTCRYNHGFSHQIRISEKEGHMQLALTAIRHVTSQNFKDRFFPRRTEGINSEDGRFDNSESTSQGSQKGLDDGDGEESIAKVGEFQNKNLTNDDSEGVNTMAGSSNGTTKSFSASGIGKKTVDDNGPFPGDEPTEGKTSDTTNEADRHGELKQDSAAAQSEVTEENEIQSDDGDSDMSMDSEDRGEVDEGQYYFGDESDNEMLRYEIRNLFFHARRVEELLTAAEKKPGHEDSSTTQSQPRLNQDWNTLQHALYNFIVEDNQKFQEWRRFRFPDENLEWNPVVIGAVYGLTSLLERHLGELDDPKAALHELFDVKYIALDLALETPDRVDVVQKLLEKGSDPNFLPDGANHSTFMYAMDQDASLEYTNLLLKYGGSCTQKGNNFGSTALHRFALNGRDIRILEILLKNPYDVNNCADINAKDISGETPLHYLMSRVNVPVDLLKAFLDNGADVNAEGEFSERPLGEAAQHGDNEALKLIMDKVDNIDDDNKWGRTALHGAAWGTQLSTITELLNHNADIVRSDKHDRTPFFFACLLGLRQSREKAHETAQYLLDKMIEKNVAIDLINKPTKTKRAPLREAAAHGLDKIVEIILDRLKNNKDMVNLQDTRKERAAIHCAALHGNFECVRLLLQAGADVSLKANGLTALDLCREQWMRASDEVQVNFEKTISLLIEADRATAALDRELLSIAAMNGSVLVLERLSDANVPLNVEDSHGWTPLMIAKQHQQTAAADFIARRLAHSSKSPSGWVNTHSDIVAMSDNGLRLEYAGGRLLCMTANHPTVAGSSECYFEISIPTKDGDSSTDGVEERMLIVAIGFSTVPGELQAFPGWKSKVAPTSKSWGYHADDGGYFHEQQARTFGRPYGYGDTVGCGVDLTRSTIFFTRNGTRIGE